MGCTKDEAVLVVADCCAVCRIGHDVGTRLTAAPDTDAATANVKPSRYEAPPRSREIPRPRRPPPPEASCANPCKPARPSRSCQHAPGPVAANVTVHRRADLRFGVLICAAPALAVTLYVFDMPPFTASMSLDATDRRPRLSRHECRKSMSSTSARASTNVTAFRLPPSVLLALSIMQ